MNRSLLITILAVVFFTTLFLVLGTTVKVPYTAMVIYQEQEPYEEIVTEIEKETYTTEECKDIDAIYKIGYVTQTDNCLQNDCATYEDYCVEKNFWGNCIRFAQRCLTTKCIKYNKNCKITIENKEKQWLNFNLELYKENFDSGTLTLIKGDNIGVQALDSSIASWGFVFFTTDNVGCRYKLKNTPKIQDCNQVIKSKEVPKEKTVIKTRSTERKKSETRYETLFQSWGIISNKDTQKVEN